MKRILSGLSLFILASTTYGQGTIEGQIRNKDGKAVPYVNIILLAIRDSSIVKAAMSDESGKYRIDSTPEGRYIIRYSSAGYRSIISRSIDIPARPDSLNLGTQIIENDPVNLKEVTVEAQTSLYRHEADRLVINAQSSVLTKGSTIMEVLARSPGLYIDRETNNISLNGKSGVTIMINGKLMRMPLTQVVMLLNSMSANNLDKIELLTTPPAKYDAEGNAGIINIVTKKMEGEGTKGVISLTGGYGWGEKSGASFNLAHNHGKLDLFCSYSFSSDRSYSDWAAKGSETAPVIGRPMVFDFSSNTTVLKTYHNATVGTDVSLGKTTLGGNINLATSKFDYATFAGGSYDIQQDSSYLLANSNIGGTSHWLNLISSFYAEHSIRAGERVNLGIDYIYYLNDGPTAVQNDFTNKTSGLINLNDTIFAPHVRANAHTPIHTLVAVLDYTKQLSKKWKFESGLKGTSTRSASTSMIESQVNGDWISSPDRQENILMTERIGAAYALVSAQLNTVTFLSIGARIEYSDTHMVNPATGETVADRKKAVLFPSVFFTRKLGENSELQISYTKRIGRPSYNDLASYIAYNDFLSVFTGNPLLLPTITHNLKFGYNHKALALSLLFSRDNHPIAATQVVAGPGGGLLYIGPQNMEYRNSLIFQVDLPWKVTPWLTLNQGFVGGPKQFKLNYTPSPVERNYFSYSAYGTQTLKLPANFALEISEHFYSADYAGTVKVDGFGVLEGGIKKTLKNNGGTFQVSVDDLLRTMQIQSHFGTLTQEAFSLKSDLIYDTESSLSRIFKLTYSRSFGDNTVPGRRKTERISREESDRLRNY